MTQPYPGDNNPNIDAYLHAINDENVRKYLGALHKSQMDKQRGIGLYSGPDNPDVDKYLKAIAANKGKTTKPPAKPVPKPVPKPAVTKPSGAIDPLSGLPNSERNAYKAIEQQLSQYGLQSLAPKILQYVKEGYDGDSLGYVLSQTPEYKQRFSANDQRIKAGLPALSPSDYIATERALRDVLRSSGLPANFYDSPDDVQSLIANDISPTELKDRTTDAFKFAQNAVDPNAKAALMEFYGIGDPQIAAHFLDPRKSEAELQRQVAAAQIAGAYKANGIVINQQHAEGYADNGVSLAQAQQDASQAGLILQDTLDAGNRFNTQIDQQDVADAFSGGLASQQRKIKTLANSEVGAFGGDTQQIGSQSTSAGGGY